MNKVRIDMMNDRLKNSKPQLDTERAKLVTEAYAKFSAYTPVLRRAHAFAYILDNMEPNMQDGELIVGSQTKRVRGVPVFPEFGARCV